MAVIDDLNGSGALSQRLTKTHQHARSVGIVCVLDQLNDCCDFVAYEFGTKEAMADDQKVAEVYGKKGAKVADLDEATVDKWREIARPTAWKDYAGKTPLSAELLKLAEGVQVS